MHKKILTALLMILPLCACAQVGDHRSDLSIGGNAGYVLSNVGFDPKVSQSMHEERRSRRRTGNPWHPLPDQRAGGRGTAQAWRGLLN